MPAPAPSLDQQMLDYLLPAGQTKFGVHQLCRLLAPEGEALAPRTMRDALIVGQLGGFRLPFSATPGTEERIKVEWATREDVILYLLRNRTLLPTEHLTRLLALIDPLPAPALDLVLRHATACRARAPRA